MKRVSGIAVLALMLSTIALPVAAKGAFEATITGPGIDDPIVLDGRQAASLQDGRLRDLMDAIVFWELAYTEADSPHRSALITLEPPTSDLGPEYTVVIGHSGPGGQAYVDVLVYPDAAGGSLVRVEPGVEVTEMRAVTSGGWYRSSTDLGAMFEEYGAAMTEAKKKATVAVAAPSAASPPPSSQEPAGFWLPVLLAASLSGLLIQALRKRKRDELV